MNKKRNKKAPFNVGIAVLLAMFILPMLLSTAVAIPTTETSTTPMSDFIPSDVEHSIQDRNVYFDSSKLDNHLVDWVESREVPAGIVMNEKKVSIMLLTTGIDKTFGGLIEPVGSIILNDKMTWVHALVSNLANLKTLTLDPTVKMIQADEILEGAPDLAGINFEIAERGAPSEFTPIENKFSEDEFPGDMAPPIDVFSTRDLIGATYVQDTYGVNGTTSVIQIQDSGVDLGHTAFAGAQLIDANGNPMSIDPTGRGFALSQLVSYDLLQKFFGVQIPAYLDPLHTDANGNINISAIRSNLCTFKPDSNSYSIGYGRNLPDLYHVGALSGNTTGFLFGIVHSLNGYQTYKDTLIPFILADGNNDAAYDTLYLDFDAGYNYTLWWDWQLSDPEFGATVWDFEDELPKTNGGDYQLSADLENKTHGYGYPDGYNDISIGGLSTSLDHTENFSKNALPFVHGINSNGRVFAHMWDINGHGTSCASNALGRSVEYEIYKNAGIDKEGIYDLKGIAPDAKLIASKGYGEAEVFYGWSWAAGFEPINENNTWEFVPNSGHAANVSSNSWGYSDFHYDGIVGGFDFSTMLMDYLSVPTYIDPDYPGILMLTSSGNGGPGTGTNRQGGQSPLALMVGASTNNWIRQIWGYPYEDQPADQIIGWSDAGPNNFGYPTLDVVNVGAFDFSVTPIDWTRPTRVGGYYNYDYFGGTSQACPMTAGVMGLIYDAWAEENPGIPLNPMVAKTIIKSTAKDLGYDVYHQGNGRADAREAVAYIRGDIDTNGDEILRAQTNESIKNIVDRFELAYFRNFYEDHPALTNETIDGSLYGGVLLPGDSIDIDFNIDGNSSNVDITDFTMQTQYTEQNNSMTTYDGFSDFNITDTFNMGDLLDADFFQLSVGINFSISDWLDTNGTRQPIVYIQGFDGENRTFINYAYNRGNVQTLFMPTDFLKNTGDFKIQIRVRDFGFETYGEDWDGLDVSMAIRAFKRVDDSHISVSEVDPLTLRATITTDTDQIPGMYGGFVVVNTTADNQLLVPYGYSVASNVSQMDENGWTEISGITNRINDNGMYGAIDWSWRPDTGDWRYYDFVLNTSGFTDEDPNTLLLEVEWELEGSAIDCWIVDAAGYVVGMTDYATAAGKYLSYVNTPGGKMQRLLVDMHGYVDGTWTEPYENHTNSGLGWDIFSLVLHSSATDLNDTILALEPFSIRMAWINESVSTFNTPTLHYSVTGGLNYNGVMTTNGDLTVGWTDADNSYGYETDVYDVFIYPGREINIYETVSPVDQYYYVDLVVGDFVTMSFGWDQPETDLDFFLNDPNGVEVAHAASLANPEIIQYYVLESGEYEIEVDYYSGLGTPYNTAYDIIIQSPGDSYLFEDVATGTDLVIDLNVEGVADGQYFVETNTYGWNFDYTDRTTFIYDTSAPVFDSVPADATFPHGPSIDLEWEISDLVNFDYTISLGTTELATGSFDEKGTVTYTFTPPSIAGEYILTMTVVDHLGHESIDTVTVTTTNSPPTLSTPADKSYVYGQTDQSISWVVSDDIVGEDLTYSISVDGVEKATGTWKSFGSVIKYNITGWEVGTYEVVITVNDGLGGSASDSVNVIVTKQAIPGYSTGFLLVALLGTATFLIKKRK